MAKRKKDKCAKKMGTTMGEFYSGKLKTGRGKKKRKVTSREQAVRIGLEQQRAMGCPVKAYAGNPVPPVDVIYAFADVIGDYLEPYGARDYVFVGEEDILIEIAGLYDSEYEELTRFFRDVANDLGISHVEFYYDGREIIIKFD